MSSDALLDALRQDVRQGAATLLGAYLIKENLVSRIVETEAYRGLDDPGSHAHRGPTPRNRVMFGEPGRAYVYFTYGMHWMVNVTAQTPGVAAAVLIRAAEPLEGLEAMFLRRPKAACPEDLLSGPAKICAAYAIGPETNGIDLFAADSPLRIEPGHTPAAKLHGPRVGLAEGKGELHLWRFADANRLRWVSNPRSNLSPLSGPPDRIPPAYATK